MGISGIESISMALSTRLSWTYLADVIPVVTWKLV